jgi:hypothetical protein
MLRRMGVDVNIWEKRSMPKGEVIRVSVILVSGVS